MRFMPRETLFKCQMVERSRTGGLVDQNHYKRTRTAQEQIPQEDKVFASTGEVALSIKLRIHEYARDIFRNCFKE